MFTAPLLRATEFIKAAAAAIENPNNGEVVAAVGDLSAPLALSRLQRIMMSDRNGRALLRQQPRITDELLQTARVLPEGSLGRAYALYMDENQFTPSGRPDTKYLDDPIEHYIMTRYRQCHDFVHSTVIAGRTVPEEVAVKLLEYTHTGLPIGALALLGGGVHLRPEQLRQVVGAQRHWATVTMAPAGMQGGVMAVGASASAADSSRGSSRPADNGSRNSSGGDYEPPLRADAAAAADALTRVDGTNSNGSSPRRRTMPVNMMCVPWEQLLPLPHTEVLDMLGWTPFPGPSTFPAPQCEPYVLLGPQKPA